MIMDGISCHLGALAQAEGLLHDWGKQYQPAAAMAAMTD